MKKVPWMTGYNDGYKRGVELIHKQQDMVYDVLEITRGNNLFDYGFTKGAKMIGICGGAQFIAKRLGSKISRLRGHVGNHKVYFTKNYKYALNNKYIYIYIYIYIFYI